MSAFSYNGIDLQVLKVKRCDRHFIYDGPTYLYTKWNIAIRALYNAAATSYDITGIGGAIVPAPRVAAITDAIIRHRLSVPRKQLLLGSGSMAMLVSPQAGFTVDSANGPQPLACNVTKIAGTKTFLVDYAIQTSLRECNLETETYPSIFLSHLWEMSQAMDEDFFTTRTIKGRVVFDAARVQQLGVVPDQYRAAMFHPIPENFQRRIPLIAQSDDGNTVVYQIEDEEQSINLGLDCTEVGVTRIEATHTSQVGVPAEQVQNIVKARAILSLISGTVGGAIAGRALGFKPGKSRIAGKIAGGFAGLTTGGLSGYETLLGMSPMLTHTVTVRVYGNVTAKRADLQTVAMRIIEFRLAGTQMAGFTSFGHEAAIEWDLKERVVEVVFKQISALIRVRTVEENRVGYPSMNMADSVPGLLEAEGGQVFNAQPPGDLISRGSFLEMIVAQALQAPCSQTPLPVGPPDIVQIDLDQNEINQTSGLPLQQPGDTVYENAES